MDRTAQNSAGEKAKSDKDANKSKEAKEARLRCKFHIDFVEVAHRGIIWWDTWKRWNIDVVFFGAHLSKIAAKTDQPESKDKKAKKEAKQEKKEAKEEKKDEAKQRKKAEDKEDKKDELKRKKKAEDKEDKQNGLKQKLKKEKEEEEMKEEKREEMKEEAKMEIKEEVKAEIEEKTDQAMALHRSDMIWSFGKSLSYVSFASCFFCIQTKERRNMKSDVEICM